MIKKTSFTVLLTVVVLLSVGIAYSYEAITQSSSTIGSEYCMISAMVGDDCVEDLKVINGINKETYYLGFSSNRADYQETLSLEYTHTMGTDIVLAVDFSCSIATGDPIIKCISNDTILGSTSLTGESVKTGSIKGIILPLSGNVSGTVVFKFQVEGIDLDTPVQMSLSVHPLEVFA